MSLTNESRFRRRRAGHRRHRSSGSMADINITPMVDVMLVLLIIFMVSAPMLTSAVKVNLPTANASAVQPVTKPITVSIKADGAVYLEGKEVGLNGLLNGLKKLSQGNLSRRVYVRGDKAVPYGRVVQVMAVISTGGFSKVALLAAPPASE